MKTKFNFTLFIFMSFLVFFTGSCVSTKPALQTGNIPQDFVPFKHLVFIGLDGWGGAYVQDANMPTVKRMMSDGAWCLSVLNVRPSVSWPNWTSLFCGAPPEQRESEDFPSIFTVVKNNGQKSAFFYEWTELPKICPDPSTEKYAIFSNVESAQKVAAYIEEQKPVFTAVVFDEPDHTGHSKNWGSPPYYAKLKELDGLIAIIEQAVKNAGIYDSTVFVLSADHGGSFFNHEANFYVNRRTPLVIFGNGIKEGFEITSPAGICDIAPTMAALIGMDIPPEWTGRPLFEIFK